MKKPLIYSLAVAALIGSTAFTAAISSFATTEQDASDNNLVVDSDLAEPAKSNIIAKSENVYIITNADGSLNKSFINNTLNESSEPMPVEMKITYTLDGAEISPAELVGKSGHVEIKFEFAATKSYQGKLIPFLTVTGLDFDGAKFSNVKIDNGKIIAESDNILLAGYTVAGLNEDLGTELLPNSFTVNADVKDFEMADTYTFATNEIFADIDTTKLNSADDLIDSVNELGSALDKILAGSTELKNGAHDLAVGANKLAGGAHDLANGAVQVNTGANDLAAGADELSGGLKQLVAFDDSILAKVDATTGTVTATIQELITKYHIDPNSELIKRINNSLSEYYGQAYTAVTTYTGNIEKLSDGAERLAAGAGQLADGTAELKAGATQLANGADELASGAGRLASGSETLNSGIATFKAQGIDKLANFANRDFKNFLNNTRATVKAADSYHHYANSTAQSVKFIFKTPAVK